MSGWGVLAGNISKWFTPKQVRDRQMADLIKRRDKLLESQSKWTKEDSVELDRIVDRIQFLGGVRPE